MQKFLIAAGILLALIGLCWQWLSKIPFFKLPGDIVIENENFKFYFPIVSMVIISILISLVYWLIKKL